MPNSAPTLNSLLSPVLTTTFENAISPAWTSVSSLLGGGSDADSNTLGIAITALDTSLGTWQFSNDAGANWLTIHAGLINSTTNELALLLAPTALVRMVPFGELSGTLADAITFRAWDQTSGNQGDYVVIAGTGADSAFSSDSDTAALSVSAVNDAPTFAPVAGTGKALVPVGIGDDFGSGLTVQPDGRIVVAGYSSNGSNDDFSLIRLNAAGTLDTSFNGTGKVLMPVGSYHDYGMSVNVQPEGKIVVAGISQEEGSDGDFSLIRLNADGTLDTSFNGTGKVTVPVGTSHDVGRSVTVQPDGKIVVAGYSFNGNDNDFSLIRLNADGTLDTSFNLTGKLLVPLGTAGDLGYSVTVQPDGKIVVAGHSASATGTDFSLIRLNADGTPDTSFNGTGELLVPVGTGSYDYGQSVTVQPDGKIVVSGYSIDDAGSDFSLIRLNADGTLDTSFNGTGKAVLPVGTAYDGGYCATVQADGKIVVAGENWNGVDWDCSLIRLNANGTLDTGFNGTGKVLLPVGTFDDGAASVTVQPDGKIVVGGVSHNGSDYDFNLFRLNADGTLDTTFIGTATATLGGTVSYTENAVAIALDSTVSIYDPELAAQGSYKGAAVTLARHDAASSDDIFSGLGNLSFSAGNAVLSGVVIGTVTTSGGTLTITFNSSATQERVNEALSSVGYANGSDKPAASVQIDWSFSDGNVNAQGTGGALSATGSTTVNIAPVNDLPTGAVTISGVAKVGNLLTASNTLADADGIATPVAYQWKANGADIDGAVGDTFTVTSAEVGKIISVEASYTDGGGTDEAVTGTLTRKVGAVLVARIDDRFLFGTPGDDTLIGAGGRTKMLGGAGDDTYLVTGFDQVLEEFDEGQDTVISKVAFTLGPNVENLILAGTSEVSATGNELDNVLVGNAMRNKITGQAGADTLTGGGGADLFIYQRAGDSDAARYDTITDFNAADGDRIRLTGVDANETQLDDQKFIYIGSRPFSDFADATALLRFDPVTHQLEGSVNADGAAELVIVLAGVVSLKGADFDL